MSMTQLLSKFKSNSRFVVVVFVLAMATATQGQDYSSFQEKIASLYSASGDSLKLERAWNDLVESGNIPLVVHDSVAFLFKGVVTSVQWNGDFNRWGQDRNFSNKGRRIPGTDVWILKATFPLDARMDYKIVIDDSGWILDPHNEDHQWSGVGGGSPNSELRMPDWKQDPIASGPVEGLKHGKVERDLLLNSKMLNYQVTYSVYLPHHYKHGQTYPVVYVTDGYEYMHERLGNMILILDNLIHLGKIQPIVAVFIDHREPINRSNNRRMQELAMNDKYLSFLTDELKPLIEKNYAVSKEPAQTGILGTSMGGLSAAYFAFAKPDVFGLAGIQSPAFWFRPEIFTFCDNPENPPVKTFLTTGLINDGQEGAKRMKSILEKNTCTYQYTEVNQGHSWGNWRDTIDDILVYFFPPATARN